MMEHRAFLLNYSGFEKELQPILERALASGNVDELVSFINDDIHVLRDPYEGQSLDETWQTLIEFKDAHQYGDFALTKYYDPLGDIGLGSAWQDVQNALPKDIRESPILGSVIGPADNVFDPGKMGSYFQSWEQVHRNRERLIQRSIKSSAAVAAAIEMLGKAESAQTGLYVTF